MPNNKLNNKKKQAKKEKAKEKVLNRRKKIREEAKVQKELDRIRYLSRDRIPPIRKPKDENAESTLPD